jgi:cell filamentation protein
VPSLAHDWAGELRTIEISKGNTRFAFGPYLESLGQELFSRLKAERYLAGLDQKSFVERLAWFYSESNTLHPFREGNGRAIRTLLSLPAYQTAGVVIAWDRMSAQANVDASAHTLSPRRIAAGRHAR